MSTKALLRSFAGGELAPELYGRPDLVKFQTGFGPDSKNFIVLPHGPAANRPGFEYVIETKDSTKESVLIPFVYSTLQTYALEFGDQYLRIHTQGGTLLEASQAITSVSQASPGVFGKVAHGYSNGQWLYLSGVTGMAQLNGRYVIVAGATADTFTATDLAGNAINTTGYGAFTAGNAARVFELATPYLEADIYDLHYTQSADVLTIVHPSYQQRELRRLGSSTWELTTVAFSPTINTPGAPTVTTGGPGGGTATSHQYRATALAEDGLEESLGSAASSTASIDLTVAGNYVDVVPQAAGALGPDETRYTRTTPVNYWYTSTQSNNASLYWNGALVGNPTRGSTTFSVYTRGALMETVENPEIVEPGAPTIPASTENFYAITGPSTGSTPTTGAVRYNIYKLFNGLWGYIGQTVEGSALRDNNITPDVSKTPPEENDPFVGAGNYPGAVGYFQGRRWFAGTDNKPQNLWGTRSGTESNMSYSIPTRDDDSISVRLTSRQANTIRHIVPLGDLLLLTSGGEWKVDSGGAAGPVTPASIDYRPEDYIGASNVQPVIANGAVLYSEPSGHLMEMKYTWESQGYKPTDISVVAPHLFDGYTVTSMAYTRKPYKALWAVRSDGVLLGLTYVPEHQVTAWHHHDTDGTFESVAAVREGTEDALYAVIKRNINGRDVRYIERMHSRAFTELADAFFVDAGATYSGAASATITGLWHLEGETVAILADGAVQPQQVVTNGAITLANAAAKVHVGLAYTSDLETLPLALETEALSQATRKNVNKVHLRVYRSSGVFVGPSFDKLTEAKQRTTEPYGSPPALRTGILPVTVRPTWADDGTFCVRQSDPLPLTILGLVPEIA